MLTKRLLEFVKCLIHHLLNFPIIRLLKISSSHYPIMLGHRFPKQIVGPFCPIKNVIDLSAVGA